MAYNKMDGDSDAAEAHAKARGKKVSMAKKMTGKEQSREIRSKKAGFYVHGHKNYGDVYEK